jgi:Protein of unknown function (DUF3662)/FHA domain
MSLLRTLESKIEGLVEGTFGRVFRSEVRPIELARKLVREMDEHRMSSLSRMYAPHEYDLWLSPRDRDHYEGIESEVLDELGAYLLEHARREQLVLAGRPTIRLHTDHDLSLGEFGIQTHPVRLDGAESGQEERAPVPRDADLVSLAAGASHARRDEPLHAEQDEDAAGRTMIQRASRHAPPRAAASASAGALLLVSGRRLMLSPAGAVLGRSRECDVVLDDSGISRRHAQIRSRDGSWTIEDLGSTNGLRVNGRRVIGATPLNRGDRIEMGSTEIAFELR